MNKYDKGVYYFRQSMGERAYTLYNVLLKLAVPPSISKTHMCSCVYQR